MSDSGRRERQCVLTRVSMAVILLTVLASLIGRAGHAFVLLDTPAPTADAVFGQGSFTTNTTGSAIGKFNDPVGVVFDDTGVMYVTDVNNHRILVYTNQSDTLPDLKIGNDTTGVNANQLNNPYYVDVWNGRETTVLFVADQSNNRVAAYLVRANGVAGTVLTDTAIDYVFGQPTVDTKLANNNGKGATAISASSINNPHGVAVLDTGGSSISLFVVDQSNRRVLRYDLAKNSFGSASIDTVADAVWGQPGFTTSGSGTSDTQLTLPYGVFATADRLYISEVMDPRVVVELLTDPDTIFDAVYGQRNLYGADQADDTNRLMEAYDVTMNSSKTVLAISDVGRILIHTDTTGADTNADQVIGDTDFFGQSRLVNPSSQTLYTPSGIFFRGLTEFWVADANNHRVLRYDASVFSATSSSVIGVSRVVAPLDTAVNLSDSLPKGATDTYVQVNLTGGGTTSGTLVAAADSIGTNANYKLTTTLSNVGDTVTTFVWTSQSSPAIFLGLRSDTAGLSVSQLPSGITSNDTGLAAMLATTMLVRFAGSDGRMIGDSTHAASVGDSFAYTLIYSLSETTTRLFHSMGFDTKAGSSSFRHYFADTYGAAWTEDTLATVSVTAQTGGGIIVRIAGITRSGVDPLGGIAAGSSRSASNACLITRCGVPPIALSAMRSLRDLAMDFVLGRRLTALYYTLFA